MTGDPVWEGKGNNSEDRGVGSGPELKDFLRYCVVDGEECGLTVVLRG